MQEKRWRCKHLRSVKRWGEEGEWMKVYKKEKQHEEGQQKDGTETRRKMVKNNEESIFYGVSMPNNVYELPCVKLTSSRWLQSESAS